MNNKNEVTDFSRMYIDINIIQSYPSNCKNRDDTGSPKQSGFGGTTRDRTSSQAQKYAARQYMTNNCPEEELGSRTKKAVDLIAAKIAEITGNENEDENKEAAETALKNAGIEISKGKSQALLFISPAQVDALAQLAADKEKDKALYKNALEENPSSDMSLTGRMVAGNKNLQVDAAVWVANAISTHNVNIEYDYYTAMDDLEDNANAAMLGTSEFDSATEYRFATVNVHELMQTQGDLSGQVVKDFVKAFCLSVPKGKISGYAHCTVPDLVYITIRNDQAINLSNAFENAIKPSGNGYIRASKQRLAEYAEGAYRVFVNEPEKAYICEIGEDFSLPGIRVSLNEMLDQLKKDIDEFTEKNKENK